MAHTAYRVSETRKGWIVQYKRPGQWFWATHHPFGLPEWRFYKDEMSAMRGANICRRADVRAPREVHAQAGKGLSF